MISHQVGILRSHLLAFSTYAIKFVNHLLLECSTQSDTQVTWSYRIYSVNWTESYGCMLINSNSTRMLLLNQPTEFHSLIANFPITVLYNREKSTK